MTYLQLKWLSVERALASAILVLGLLALFATPSHASCDASAYITGDLVGDGNPAEVYAAMCPPAASATTPA